MHSQISKEAFSLQAFSGYQALYNTNLKVVFKPFRAIKPCIRVAFASGMGASHLTSRRLKKLLIAVSLTFLLNQPKLFKNLLKLKPKHSHS